MKQTHFCIHDSQDSAKIQFTSVRFRTRTLHENISREYFVGIVYASLGAYSYNVSLLVSNNPLIPSASSQSQINEDTVLVWMIGVGFAFFCMKCNLQLACKNRH